MRLTVLNQTAKGLPITFEDDDKRYELREPTLKAIESIKWYLWHGNTYEALQHLESLEMDLDAAIDGGNKDSVTRKLLRAAEEFHTYIANNQAFITNYGERYRQGERISTGFVESTVNYVVAKRFTKRQQMQWSPKGAHLLLQMRTRVLNDELEQTFREWYPGFRTESDEKKRLKNIPKKLDHYSWRKKSEPCIQNGSLPNGTGWDISMLRWKADTLQLQQHSNG